MIRAAGQDRAQAEYGRGAGTANFFASLGPIAFGIADTIARTKAHQAEQDRLRARDEMQARATDALAQQRMAEVDTARRAEERKAAQEAAWGEFISGAETLPDRSALYRKAIGIFGPEQAGKVVEGALGAAPKPSEVSAGASLVDPVTGRIIMTAPKPEAPPGAGFELSPGQTRFDASGKPIASLPPRPDEESKARIWVMRPNAEGKLEPVRVRESEVRPGDKPANTREQGRAVTSGDAGRLADVSTSLNQLKSLRDQIGNLGTSSRIGAALWDPITEATGLGAESKATQGVIERVKQIIGKTLEGGVLRKEDEVKYAKILPKIGDSPDVARAKLEGLEAALRDKGESLLVSLEDAGYDVTKYRQREASKAGAKAEEFDETNSYGYAVGKIIKNEKGERRLWNGKRWVKP